MHATVSSKLLEKAGFHVGGAGEISKLVFENDDTSYVDVTDEVNTLITLLEGVPPHKSVSTPKLIDGDYEVDTSVWLTVGNISVRVYKTDEGVVCDMWPLNSEDGEPLATTYAFFHEAEPEGEVNGS